MIDQILPIIGDPKDYMAALSILKSDESPSKDEVDSLLAVYAKYLDADQDYSRVCVALDLLRIHKRKDKQDFSALELGDETLDALFFAYDMPAGLLNVPVDTANEIVLKIKDERISISVRILLARLALDTMSGALNFAEIQPQIRELAEFLMSVGTETLNHCSVLAREVRMKCRK